MTGLAGAGDAFMEEMPNVRQVKGESQRRWFTSPDFDLHPLEQHPQFSVSAHTGKMAQ